MNSQAFVAHQVADFALSVSWAGLPDRVRSEAVRANLNWVGCAVGGAGSPTAAVAVRAILRMGSAGGSLVFGRAEKFDMANAALLNCLHSAAHAFDDTHLTTITHPTGPVAAAALATVDALAASGRAFAGEELLLALALGIEIECRLSNAVKTDGMGADLGWYVTGISGGVGAAVAVGRLLGLTADRMVAAIGLAAAQACGIRATHGSMATAYVPAVACRNGLTAAWLAAEGFTCGDGVIDGRNGLLQVLSPHTDVERMRRGLGSEFELLANAYKPYPCGIVIHPALDACLQLYALTEVRSGAIERVDFRVHPDTLNLCGRRLPATPLEAQISLYHWAAAALVHGRAGIAQGEQAALKDETLRQMQARIFAVADQTLAGDEAHAGLTLRDGRRFDVHVAHATGSAANPMTDAQLAAKFLSLSTPVLGRERADRLLATCLNLNHAENALEMFRDGVL